MIINFDTSQSDETRELFDDCIIHLEYNFNIEPNGRTKSKILGYNNGCYIDIEFDRILKIENVKYEFLSNYVIRYWKPTDLSKILSFKTIEELKSEILENLVSLYKNYSNDTFGRALTWGLKPIVYIQSYKKNADSIEFKFGIYKEIEKDLDDNSEFIKE